jgi:hypothetical protein
MTISKDYRFEKLPLWARSKIQMLEGELRRARTDNEELKGKLPESRIKYRPHDYDIHSGDPEKRFIPVPASRVSIFLRDLKTRSHSVEIAFEPGVSGVHPERVSIHADRQLTIIPVVSNVVVLIPEQY